MKMKDSVKQSSFRQSMSGLHTWAGLLPAWILYFIFITGTAGYFRVEITRWMQPEIPFAGDRASQSQMIEMAEQYLSINAANADEWYIGLPDNRESFIRLFWEQELSDQEKQNLNEEQLDTRKKELEGKTVLYPQTGLPIGYSNGAAQARDTGGGEDLYLLHYLLHYVPRDTARYLVIYCTLFMLVGLMTGIVIHKKIFKDFFTFRPGKKQRSWLDMHNIFSVLTLPFLLMITYSGLLFFITNLLPQIAIQPAVMVGELGFDIPNVVSTVQTVNRSNEPRQDVLQENLSDKNQVIVRVVADALNIDIANIFRPEKDRDIDAAPLLPLTHFLEDANQRWPHKIIDNISIDNPYASNALVMVEFRVDAGRNRGELIYSGVSGELIVDIDDSGSAPQKINNALLGLHEGRFSPMVLRWLYFVTGLMGAGMVATGTILWTVKRRNQYEKSLANGTATSQKGLVFVERFNIGNIVGLPIAVAAYFWANRLLPLDLIERHEWEMHTLFIIWGMIFLWAALRPRQRGWFELLCLAATAYALLPVLNFFTTDRHLGNSLFQGDWLMAGFDLTMLVFAMAALVVDKRANRFAVKTAPWDVNELSSTGATIL